MSTGLMSCVRENSPPLEMARRESGAFSLPTNGSEPQKRRRFHPLRNLRRIFRRRTLTNAETPPSTSSPSSPSSQLSLPPTIHASVPAHNLSSYYKSPSSTDIAPTPLTAYPPHLIELSSSRRVESCGIAVVPSFASRTLHSDGFYTKDSGGPPKDSVLKSKESSTKDLEGGREMSDCQRSFSEGRLVDSDFSREGLSQSHDSVFSESATASSLSIVLKAELFDALRKRRNRPDASDEDLGLPRSPTTPLRKTQSTTNQSEMSSISMLSLASLDRDDDMSSTSAGADRTNSSVSSSKMSTSLDSTKTSDEVDFIISSGTRLSHSAAKHKMAIRPKKKGPTRIRRPVEAAILPSTLEVNEDGLKYPLDDFLEKGKSHSLPSGVNANLLEKHSQDTLLKDGAPHIKRSKTEGVTTLLGAHSVKDISILSCRDKEFVDPESTNTSLDRKDDKGNVIGRLQRNLKQNKYSGECDTSEDNVHISVIEKRSLDNNMKEHSPKLEEYRKESQKIILSDAKSNLSLMSNSLSSSPSENDSELVQKIHKPKSGPAARQRIIPMDLRTSPMFEPKSNKSITAQFIQYESAAHAPTSGRTAKELIVDTKKGKNEYNEGNPNLPIKLSETVKNREKASPLPTNEMLGSISFKSHTEESQQRMDHFEKKEHVYQKFCGLSSVMQKVSRTTETVEDTGILPRNRKAVEKSKSFRYYSERNATENDANLKSMPSLPDLTFSNKLCTSVTERQEIRSRNPAEFQMNDNNLVTKPQSDEQLPLTHGVHTKNINLTGSKPSVFTAKTTSTNTICNQSITEIEDNIDKLVKSPFLTVFKKSGSPGEKSEFKYSPKTCLSTRNRIADTVERVHKKDDKEFNVNTNDTKEMEASEKTKVESPCKSKTMESVKSDAVMNKMELGNKDSAKSLSLSKPRRNSSVVEKRADNQIPEFMKITLNRVDSTRPKSNIVLSKNIKPESEVKDSRRYSNESVDITDNKPPLPSDLYSKANSLKIVDESPAVKLNKKLDHENNILNMPEYTLINHSFYDRRKSTTDEKLKYEKKIVELRAERKKSIDDSVSDPRKTSIDEETGVVLRKKSFANSNQSANGEDTPELMKVFARRSLKIKDDEFQYSYEELEKSNTLKKFNNLDSDKENQSSSEEKLEKLPKSEITKPMNVNESLSQKFDDKNRNSFIEFRKPSGGMSSPQNNSYAQPIRFSSIVGYKSVSAMYAKGTQLSKSALDQSSPSNLNEANNNTNTNNNNKLGGIRHTIGGSSNHITDQTEENEFKGILQRRAEWEKRAKEALK